MIASWQLHLNGYMQVIEAVGGVCSALAVADPPVLPSFQVMLV